MGSRNSDSKFAFSPGFCRAQLSALLRAGVVSIGIGVLPGLVAASELTRTEFMDTYPEHRVEGFDSLRSGVVAPLDVPGGFLLAAGTASPALRPEVSDDFAGLGTDFWFGSFGSAPNFVLANIEGYRLTFDEDVIALGFEASSVALGSENISFQFFSADGELLQTHTIALKSFTSNGHFLSFVPAAPFAEVVFNRDELVNWMIDDVRFVTSVLFKDGFGD